MKWVGLTGGLGTGKSTVSQMLVSRGIAVIDADRIAKQVTEVRGPALPAILQAFGPGLQNKDGSLDRQALAQLVFGNPEKLLQLEKIIHPLVQDEVKRQKKWIQEQGALWAVYDVPLLFEKNLQSQFDYIVVVTVNNPQILMDRLKQRNSWNNEEIQKRMASQKPLSEKIKQAHYVIENDASLSELEKKVDTLVQMLNDLWQE